MASRFATGTTSVLLALPLSAGIIFGSMLALLTLQWGNTFIFWQLFWWLFVSLVVGSLTYMLARLIFDYITAKLGDLYLHKLESIAFYGVIIGFIALLAGLAASIWAIIAGSVTSAPITLYWSFPLSASLFAAGYYINGELALIKGRDCPARKQREIEESNRRRIEVERRKRCAGMTSLQRLEFEDQFLQGLYSATNGDTTEEIELEFEYTPELTQNYSTKSARPRVWSVWANECAPDLIPHAIKVWRKRKCIKVSYHHEIIDPNRTYLSLTVAGRDLCMRAEELGSMQEALSERFGRYRVKNEYHFQNANVVGTNAHVHDSKLAQTANSADQLQLEKLAQELAKLRSELLKIATSAEGRMEVGGIPEAEVGIAIGEVSKAEEAARRGDQQVVMQHLANMGRWVLGAAKQIGIQVAVEAINAAFKA